MQPDARSPAWRRPAARWAAALGSLLWALTLTGATSRPQPPDPPREFRGAWLATVANLDWPSSPGLPVAEQQNELKRLFTRASDLNLNVIMFQVRPGCDTVYKSSREPW